MKRIRKTRRAMRPKLLLEEIAKLRGSVDRRNCQKESRHELFAKTHPKQFAQDVKGKPLLFFTKIGYHGMTAE